MILPQNLNLTTNQLFSKFRLMKKHFQSNNNVGFVKKPSINPFTTGEVNIYKGNVPSEYGGRLSSVIKMTSKDANTKDIAGEFSIGPVTSNITLELPVVQNKSGLMIGARGAYAGWILRSLDDKQLNNSDASFYDVILKYNHEISSKDEFIQKAIAEF